MNSYQSDPKHGISCILIAMTACSLMDAFVKLLSDRYPLHEIVMVRSVIAITLTLFIIHFEGGLGLLRTSKPFQHLARGMLIAVANMTFYMSLSVMPLAEVVAIFFISPVLITALSVFLLGEKVGWHRWTAVIVGFIGVAVMMRLGTDSFNLVSVLPLIAAFTYALTQIITRRIGNTEKASVMSFYITAVFIVISTGFWITVGDGSLSGHYGPSVEFLFRPWSWPDMSSAVIMVTVGFLMTIVGYMLSQAYRVAQVNIIAPFEYVALPMGIIWGYVFWREVPDVYTFLGILMVGGSGLYVFFREHGATASPDQTYAVANTEQGDI